MKKLFGRLIENLAGRRKKERPLYKLTEYEEFSHAYCYFVHDQMVDFIMSGEEAGIATATINFKEESHAEEIVRLSGEDLWYWLDKSGYHEELDEMTFHHISLALLSDFCHFIYEALSCTSRGKTTVAYALLRKPLKDNLLYLEWMLTDRDGFIKTMRLERIEDLSIQSIPKEKKIEIISNALEMAPTGPWINPEFLYDLRYAKSVGWGFESSWQKAHHLITTFDHFKTEGMNFNFIFSGDYERSTQSRYIYTFLPIIIFHALEVVRGLFRNFGIIVAGDEENATRTLAGLSYCVTQAWDEAEEVLVHGVEEIMDGLEMKCRKCGNQDFAGCELLRMIFEQYKVRCPKCGKTSPLH